MRVLSLFDGMSCGQLALKKSNIKVTEYMACEIDPHAIAVVKENFPSTVHLGDVSKIDFSSLGKIDLLIGGSPCQGFSFAGKQLDFEDPRSKLFFEFHRALQESNPTYFLLENVKMKKQSQDIISEYLGVEPQEINSKFFTGQSRKRLYWTNIPVSIYSQKGKDVHSSLGLKEDEFMATVGSSDDRVLRRTPFAGCLTATMFKGARAAGRPIVSKVSGVHIDEAKGLYRMLTPEECEILQSVPLGYTSKVSKSQRYKMLGNGWTVDVISHILDGLKAIEYMDAL